MSGLADGTRVVVSGNPTAEELAAVLLAVDAAQTSEHTAPWRPSGWQRAARLEGVGWGLAQAPADLTTT